MIKNQNLIFVKNKKFILTRNLIFLSYICFLVILPHIGSATYATRNLMISNSEDNIYNYFMLKPMVSELKL